MDSVKREKYTPIDLIKLKNRKIACLTLDLEQDYGDLLNEPTYEGLSLTDAVVSLFKKKDIPLTCFVQGSLFDTHPYVIEQLSELDVEYEVHGYSHPGPTQIDHEFEISRGKKAFVRFFGRRPLAYRSPASIISQQMYDLLPLYGFKFDSSVIPSLRPGGYFNGLDKPIMPYSLDNCGLVEFPLTVFSRVIRIPISLSYVKLLGKPYFRLLQISNLPALLIFSFHLHDLCNLSSSSRIPFADFSPLSSMIFRRIYGGRSDSGTRLLESLINLILSKGYEFSRLVDVYRAIAGEDRF